VKNFEVARPFDLMADLLEMRGENPVRIPRLLPGQLNLQSFTGCRGKVRDGRRQRAIS
jgi:hypothetical protein